MINENTSRNWCMRIKKKSKNPPILHPGYINSLIKILKNEHNKIYVIDFVFLFLTTVGLGNYVLSFKIVVAAFCANHTTET
jgi:hypothetical protein